MISSAQNPKIQMVRALQSRAGERRRSGSFVIEGVRLAEEALSSGWQAELVLYTGDLIPRGVEVVDGYRQRGAPAEMVTESVMRAASDLETPPGLLAVLQRKSWQPPERYDFILIIAGVRDPGNLGTILRTAVAAGVQAVFLTPGSVDPFSPKVLRGGMGAHFRLPIFEITWEEIGTWLSGSAVAIYVADAQGELRYDQADLRQPLALVVGGEAAGPGPGAQELATARIYIPMPGGTESLNAAVAAAIILFEAVRQRG